MLAGVVLWSAVFLTVRANTESTVEPCLDTVVVEVSTACAAPQPSLLPAIPIATTVLVVATSGALVVVGTTVALATIAIAGTVAGLR